MNTQTVQISDRPGLVRRGRRLEYFTIAYNSLEGLIALVAGLMAGSIALVGFGFDSLIEVTSGAALVWRLHLDADESRREHIEKITRQQGRYAVGHGWSPLQWRRASSAPGGWRTPTGRRGESVRTAHRPARRVPVIPETRALSPMPYADRPSHPNVS